MHNTQMSNNNSKESRILYQLYWAFQFMAHQQPGFITFITSTAAKINPLVEVHITCNTIHYV